MSRPCRASESPVRSAGLLVLEWSRRDRREVSPVGLHRVQPSLPCVSPFQTREAITIERYEMTAASPWPRAPRLVHAMEEAVARLDESHANVRPLPEHALCSRK